MNTNTKPVATGIEALVCEDIARRQAHGVAKYGTTVADNPLALVQWLQHAYEESLDLSIYLRRAIAQMQSQVHPASQNALQAMRRYLGDRDPGQPGGDIADVWRAIEADEARLAAGASVGPSSTACDDQLQPAPRAEDVVFVDGLGFTVSPSAKCPAADALGAIACQDRRQCFEACGSVATDHLQTAIRVAITPTMTSASGQRECCGRPSFCDVPCFHRPGGKNGGAA
jgi:hypothetical protein